MTTASELIKTHADDLADQKQDAEWWYWRFMVCGVVLLVLGSAGGFLGLHSNIISLSAIGGVVLLFLFMRKSDEAHDLGAELLEFERPDLFGLSVAQDAKDEAREEALSILSREIVSRTRIRMVRKRARYAEASGIIIGSIALTMLIWFGFSLEDFLREYHGGDKYDKQELYEYELMVISIGLVGLFMSAWALTRFRSARGARNEIERLEIAHEIMPVERQPDASRARKLLLNNQRNLSSYYAINRFNNRVTIGVAILCVMIGIGITLWTIHIIIERGTSAETNKLLIAAIGGANAIMVNVVAAIVLKIQATISSNVNAFHDRLVRSHDIFLANVIAAEIDDPAVRRDTLASISKAIGLRQAPKAPDKDKNKDDAKKKDDDKEA